LFSVTVETVTFSTVVVQSMSDIEFQPRPLALHLGVGVAALALLAVCCSLFWLNPADSEAQIVEPLAGSDTSESAERASAELTQQGNRITWGFSDRWVPLIQVIRPSVAAIGQPPTEVAHATQLVPAPSEERSTHEPAVVRVQQGLLPLPRRRPVLAEEPRVPLPRSRPNGPAPQSVFIAVSTTDDRYPSP
jgi:hypothetical protein